MRGGGGDVADAAGGGRRAVYSYNVSPGELEARPLWDVPYAGLAAGLAERTTAHGIPHIHYARRSHVKLWFWVLVTLGLTAGCAVHMQYLVAELTGWEVAIKVEVTSERSLTFPAVTVCNLNPLRLSQVQANTDLYGRINGDAIDGVDVPDYYDDYFLEDNDFLIKGTKDTSQTRTSLLAEYVAQYGVDTLRPLGHALPDLVLHCSFNGYTCAGFSHLYNWYYGNCYTFNSGYDAATNKPIPGSVVNASSTGPLYGLRLVLSVEQAEYLPDLSDQAGVRVLVHDQYNVPFPDDEGVNAPAGAATAIGLKQNTVERYGGTADKNKYTPCVAVTGGASHADVNVYEEALPWSRYTQQACLKTCFQAGLIAACNCSDARYPGEGAALGGTNSLLPCSSTSNTQSKCKAQVTKKFANESLACNCDRQCTETYYDVTVSSATWPAENYMTQLQKELSAGNLSSSAQAIVDDTAKVKANLLQVHVYYQELNVQALEERPQYEWVQFWSDLGGALGLWVGASIMTIAEFLEHFVDAGVLACCRCCRPRRRPRQTPPPSLPRHGLDSSRLAGGGGEKLHTPAGYWWNGGHSL